MGGATRCKYGEGYMWGGAVSMGRTTDCKYGGGATRCKYREGLQTVNMGRGYHIHFPILKS